jgi:hypothetical protein
MGMGDRIVVETAQIFDRRCLQVLAFRAHFPSVSDAAYQIGECPAGVGKAEGELGKAVENFTEYQM